MLRRFIVIVLLGLTVACSRKETPQYFSHVTEIRVCSSATVKNVNASDPNRSPGFDSIYIVDIYLSDKCRNQLVREVEMRIHRGCAGLVVCSGNDDDGNFIRIDQRSRFVRLTYST